MSLCYLHMLFGRFVTMQPAVLSHVFIIFKSSFILIKGDISQLEINFPKSQHERQELGLPFNPV